VAHVRQQSGSCIACAEATQGGQGVISHGVGLARRQEVADRTRSLARLWLAAPELVEQQQELGLIGRLEALSERSGPIWSWTRGLLATCSARGRRADRHGSSEADGCTES
jgi:hypothetical protein